MKRLETADLTRVELDEKCKELKAELFHLRFKLATGQLSNYSEINKTRRNIARCLTAIGQKGVAETAEASA